MLFYGNKSSLQDKVGWKARRFDHTAPRAHCGVRIPPRKKFSVSKKSRREWQNTVAERRIKLRYVDRVSVSLGRALVG